MKIKFGTDGWRAIIGKDFTVSNVERVAQATASWLLQNYKSPSIALGHDCRFAGELFVETVAKVMCYNGVKVFMAKGFISTPMISLGTVKLKTNLGIIITASHNPPSYNGFKLKGSYGGPLLPAMIEQIEKAIPEKLEYDSDKIQLASYDKQLLEYIDLETMYCEHVERNFDLTSIRKAGLKLAYDAMYGAGQNVIKRILPNATLLHCEYNPSFGNIPPEPILKNLNEFYSLIKVARDIDCGLVTDGDADRLGLFDGEGNFIDSHHIILLLIHYLHKYKKLNGKICVAFSATQKIEKLCKVYQLPLTISKIGFKYICDVMLQEDVLVGGEESGGIAIKGHIPERDGIWVGLTIWEFMVKTGKSIKELIQEVYDIVGPFAFERSDLHIKEEVKKRIIENCEKGRYNSFKQYKVVKIDDLDGYKFHFENGDWMMVRASGTEPVLRIYAESSTQQEALNILKAGHETFLN